MMPNEPSTDPAPVAIRPLKEVWLRPRRVFRALAEQPLSFTDYALASILGIGNLLALHRSQPGDAHTGVGGIVLNSLIFGPLVGIASTFLFTSIYTRLGARAGGNSSRAAVFHVLAYGGMPVVAGLLVWGLAILLIGDAAYLAAPAKEVDGFQSFILGLEVLAYVFFLLWSVVLQVMGFSELQGVATGKAFGIWLLGQLLWIVALASLVLIAAILFPGLMPAT